MSIDSHFCPIEPCVYPGVTMRRFTTMSIHLGHGFAVYCHGKLALGTRSSHARKQESNVQQVELRFVEQFDEMPHRRLLCFVGSCAWTRASSTRPLGAARLCSCTALAARCRCQQQCNTGRAMRISDTQYRRPVCWRCTPNGRYPQDSSL